MNSSPQTNGFFAVLKEFYDAVLGDSRRHKKWLKRRRCVKKMAKGRNLDNIVELNHFIKDVEDKLNITEITTEMPSYMGAPQSDYYEIESPKDFYKKRDKTIKKFNKLRPL